MSKGRSIIRLRIRNLNHKFLTILFCSLLIGSGCARQNYELTTATTQICTTQAVEDWQFVHDFMQGVSGKDPVGHRIDTYAAYRTWVGKNWYPVDVFKQTLNGRLHHYNFYDAWTSGDEADWNNFFIPLSEFAYLLNDVKPIADSDDLHDCDGTDDCLEAEITPDQGFFSNPWFPKVHGNSDDESFLEGLNICTYGPWVYEEAHGNRPEIHPSELYWWKMPWQGSELYHLMLLQDDSNRFDRSDDFSGSSRPATWRPWSKYPRTGEFKIVFEVKLSPAEPPFTFDILEIFNRNVVTSEDADAQRDADNGKDHAIEYNGRVILKVHEAQPNDTDVGVRFDDVCRNAANSRLQGYVTITSKIGKGDRGDEGYHVLLVAAGQEQDSGVRPPFIDPDPPKVLALGKALEDSIYRGTEGVKSQLFTDVSFDLSGGPKATDADLIITKIERIQQNERKQLDYQITRQDNPRKQLAGIIKDVPMLSGSMIELTMQSKHVLRLSTPPISIDPFIAAEKYESPKQASEVWNNLISIVDKRPARTNLPDIRLMKSGNIHIDFGARYSPLRDGKVSSEDDSPITEALNEILSKWDQDRMQELLGSKNPFILKWSFLAKNLTSGVPVPVNVNQPPNGSAVQVILSNNNLTDGTINIIFPSRPENDIYELTIHGTIIDSFGKSGIIKHRVYSHYLADENEQAFLKVMLPTLASLAGLSPDELVTASSLDNIPDENRIVMNPKNRRARMVRLLTMRAVQDNIITIPELSDLIKSTKLFGE